MPRTLYPVPAVALQDLFLWSAMSLILGWFPQLVLAHLPPTTHERWAAVGSILAGFLFFFGPAFLWTLENNDKHNGRQRRYWQADEPAWATDSATTWERLVSLPPRVGGYLRNRRADPDPSPGAYLNALAGHTAVQNDIAVLLAAGTVIGVIGMLSAATPAEALYPQGPLRRHLLGRRPRVRSSTTPLGACRRPQLELHAR